MALGPYHLLKHINTCLIFFIIPPPSLLRAPPTTKNHKSTTLLPSRFSSLRHTHRLASPPPTRRWPPRRRWPYLLLLHRESRRGCQKRENSAMHGERRATVRHCDWRTILTATTTANTGLFVISVLVPFLPICNLNS